MEVRIAIAPDALDRVGELVEAAERLGLTTAERFDELGIVVGEVDPGCVDALRRLEGVDAVEGTDTYRAL